MKKLISFINESIIDPLRPTFSPELFNHSNTDNPTLKSSVQSFIQKRILDLFNEMDIIEYVLIGSTLTHRWTESSDIDLNVRVSASKKDYDKLREIASDKSGFNVPNTLHPVNFHLIFSDKQFKHAMDVADAVFDVVHNGWIRKPDDSRPFNVSDYFAAFKKEVNRIDHLKNDLKHDLIDYNQLKKLPKKNLSDLKKLIQKEIKEIEKSTLNLVKYHDKIKQNRRDAFDGPLSKKEIREYGSKNRLPENVVYKLLERHNYLEFLDKIEEIIGEDKKIDKKEADELEDFVLRRKL